VNGNLGEINIDVPVTANNGGVEMTDFIFTIQDSLTGVELALNDFEVTFFDFDVNKAQTLHERLCINNDQFDRSRSSFPSSDVRVSESKSLDCEGRTSQFGSVSLESEGVGFLCDNPQSAQDLSDVACDTCFHPQQCAKAKISQFFPIKRAGRAAKIALKYRSKFTVSLGINCKKSIGETCNRNFLFTATARSCKGNMAPMTTAAPATTQAPPPATTAAPPPATTAAPPPVTTAAPPPATTAATTAAPPATTAAPAGPTTTQDPAKRQFVLFSSGKQCKNLNQQGYLPSTSGKKDTENACLESCLNTVACNAVVYYRRSRWCSHFSKMCSKPSKNVKNSVTYITKTLFNALTNG